MDYTSTTSNETNNKEVQTPTQHLKIEGLKQNTNYTITVMASTSKGYGPASEPIFVATDQDGKYSSAFTFINASTRKVNISCLMKHLRGTHLRGDLYASSLIKTLNLDYSPTSRKRPPKMSSLGGRLRELRS